MKIEKLLDDAAVVSLLRVLNAEPDATRIVGGAVRNALLNEPVTDIDFATQLTPQRVSEICMAAGFHVVPTGIDFGTVTVAIDKRGFEVTTLREDIETDGRHAVVKFGTSWEKDAARRDFTINALYVDQGANVHAPIGGLEDLEARRVRFIGDARARIKEDYLRIWRFFRFSAQYAQDPFDAGGLQACLHEREGLRFLSAERIKQELFKLLTAKRAPEALHMMCDLGLTVETLGVQRLERFQRNTGSALERLAALCVWAENDAERLTKNLRLSRAEARQLGDIAALQVKLKQKPDEKAARVLLYHYPRAYQPALRMAEEQGWQVYLDLPQRRPVPNFPVKGADLIALGREPGPQLGALLKEIEQAWIESDFTLSRDELLKRVKQ